MYSKLVDYCVEHYGLFRHEKQLVCKKNIILFKRLPPKKTTLILFYNYAQSTKFFAPMK